MYVEWIKSAFDGYADYILIAEEKGRVVGCSLWKNPSEMSRKWKIDDAHYSLGAVHPECAGKGVFRRLTADGLELFRGQGVRFVEGPTHVNNYRVQRAYRDLGFTFVDARHSFHRWFDR